MIRGLNYKQLDVIIEELANEMKHASNPNGMPKPVQKFSAKGTSPGAGGTVAAAQSTTGPSSDITDNNLGSGAVSSAVPPSASIGTTTVQDVDTKTHQSDGIESNKTKEDDGTAPTTAVPPTTVVSRGTRRFKDKEPALGESRKPYKPRERRDRNEKTTEGKAGVKETHVVEKEVPETNANNNSQPSGENALLVEADVAPAPDGVHTSTPAGRGRGGFGRGRDSYRGRGRVGGRFVGGRSSGRSRPRSEEGHSGAASAEVPASNANVPTEAPHLVPAGEANDAAPPSAGEGRRPAPRQSGAHSAVPRSSTTSGPRPSSSAMNGHSAVRPASRPAPVPRRESTQGRATQETSPTTRAKTAPTTSLRPKPVASATSGAAHVTKTPAIKSSPTKA